MRRQSISVALRARHPVGVCGWIPRGVEYFGVHRLPRIKNGEVGFHTDRWCITHIPTGVILVSHHKTRAEALFIAKEVSFYLGRDGSRLNNITQELLDYMMFSDLEESVREFLRVYRADHRGHQGGFGVQSLFRRAHRLKVVEL